MLELRLKNDHLKVFYARREQILEGVTELGGNKGSVGARNPSGKLFASLRPVQGSEGPE